MDDQLKPKVEEALQVLVGLPLWSAGRAGNLEWFHFGPKVDLLRRDGSLKTVGAYAIHIQCAWRIRNKSSIIVASRDRLYRAGDDPYYDLEDFDWDEPGANRCDERTAILFSAPSSASLLVEMVRADNVGGFVIGLSQGIFLEAFPDDSLEGERWRFFQPGRDVDHFVMTGDGIEQ
jgi:hypothetical protein